MQKRKYKQGMDGMNLEYQLNLEGMEKLYLEPEELKNEAQNTIVKCYQYHPTPVNGETSERKDLCK